MWIGSIVWNEERENSNSFWKTCVFITKRLWGWRYLYAIHLVSQEFLKTCRNNSGKLFWKSPRFRIWTIAPWKKLVCKQFSINEKEETKWSTSSYAVVRHIVHNMTESDVTVYLRHYEIACGFGMSQVNRYIFIPRTMLTVKDHVNCHLALYHSQPSWIVIPYEVTLTQLVWIM